jgi:hypothetical protein
MLTTLLKALIFGSEKRAWTTICKFSPALVGALVCAFSFPSDSGNARDIGDLAKATYPVPELAPDMACVGRHDSWWFHVAGLSLFPRRLLLRAWTPVEDREFLAL